MKLLFVRLIDPVGPGRANHVLVLLVALLALAACGELAVEEGVDFVPSATEAAPDPVAAALAEIDDQLRDAIQGNLAHSAPSEMAVDEAQEVTLLLSPTLSQAALAAEIESSEAPQTAAIQLTPWMRAKLVSPNPEAFVINALHDDDQQAISTVEPTEWTWLVTAREGGRQRLVLTVSRLVQVGERESWRLVESYRYPIEVTVSLGSRLQAALAGLWDLKWWVGGLIFPLIVYWILRRWDR